MFDTNEKINKILGNGQGQGIGNQRQGLGFGKGFAPMAGEGFKKTNFKVNPNLLLVELQQLLDRIPEVRKAKGTLTVEFSDGVQRTLQLNYR